jgi:CrtC N-terminal lipocalin domain
MGTARNARRPQDYTAIGIEPQPIARREDGMRTTGEKGSYEWWYFDTHLDDGSSLVVVFYTKPFIEGVGKGLAPYVSVEIDRPDGSHHLWEPKVDVADFYAATDKCDVTIGSNTFRNLEWGDRPTYRIHVEDGELALDIDLVGQVPPWRPGTGYMYFGEHDEHFFAWLPSVPQGTVVVDLVLDGVREHLTGVGYHDHNWGDLAMTKLINHWYWGRGQAGPYSIVASYITAEATYGNTAIPIFMLAKDGVVIADDPDKVRFSLEGEQVDEHSGKPFAQVVNYEYEDGADRYAVRYKRESTMVDQRMIDRITGLKHLLAKVARFDGAYLRFTGQVELEHFVDGESVDKVADPGIWELMWFGHVR